MAREPYANPCDDDPIEDRRARAMVYGGRPCRNGAFPGETSVVFIIDHADGDDFARPIRAFGWMGPYYDDKVKLPVTYGAPVSAAAAAFGKPAASFDLRALHVDQFRGVTVLSDGGIVVGFAFGELPPDPERERWRTFDQMYRRYTPRPAQRSGKHGVSAADCLAVLRHVAQLGGEDSRRHGEAAARARPLRARDRRVPRRGDARDGQVRAGRDHPRSTGALPMSEQPAHEPDLPGRERPRRGPRHRRSPARSRHDHRRAHPARAAPAHGRPVHLRRPHGAGGAAPGVGFDVRPHPHIGLSTVTCLFAGENVHRDSLGTVQVNRAHDLNIMTAGRGVVHSSARSPRSARRAASCTASRSGSRCRDAHEDDAPSFEHHPAATLPAVEPARGAAGACCSASCMARASPVRHPSLPVLADLQLDPGACVDVPADAAQERGVLVIEGEAMLGGEPLGSISSRCSPPGCPRVTATQATRLFVLGGSPVGHRLIEWNFVASTRERIEAASAAWRAQTFPKIPTDSDEYIPLPEPGTDRRCGSAPISGAATAAAAGARGSAAPSARDRGRLVPSRGADPRGAARARQRSRSGTASGPAGAAPHRPPVCRAVRARKIRCRATDEQLPRDLDRSCLRMGVSPAERERSAAEVSTRAGAALCARPAPVGAIC